MSRTTIPTMRKASDVRPTHSSANEPVRRTPATTVVRVCREESASLPARLAARIPPAPTRPKSPITRFEYPYGLPERRKASVVQRTLKAAKAQAPCQARRRSTGSVHQEPERRPDQLAVAAVGAGAFGGEGPPEHCGEGDHQRGREPVDGPPAGRLGHQPRHRACEQDAQQQPGHDAGDHAAPPVLGCQVGREGDHHLAGHRGAADEDGCDGEDPQVRGEGTADECHGADAEEAGDEPPARVEVAQGHDEQQAGGIADLGGRDDGRGRPGPGVERTAQPDARQVARSRGWPPPRRWRRRSGRRVRVAAPASGAMSLPPDQATGGPCWVRRCRRAGSRR